jgi:hypothetical protein
MNLRHSMTNLKPRLCRYILNGKSARILKYIDDWRRYRERHPTYRFMGGDVTDTGLQLLRYFENDNPLIDASSLMNDDGLAQQVAVAFWMHRVIRK